MSNEETYIKNEIKDRNIKAGYPILSDKIDSVYMNETGNSSDHLTNAYNNMVNKGELTRDYDKDDYILTQKGHIAIFGD